MSPARTPPTVTSLSSTTETSVISPGFKTRLPSDSLTFWADAARAVTKKTVSAINAL